MIKSNSVAKYAIFSIVFIIQYVSGNPDKTGISKPNKNKFIDLTYAFNNETVVFPTVKLSFYTEFEGYIIDDVWGISKGFCISEHTSTHMDSPYHFNKNGKHITEIPLEDLIDIPAVMIDISHKVFTVVDGEVKVIENYVLTRDDIIEWEKSNGEILQGSIVLLKTGWGSRWPNATAFKGEKQTGTFVPDLNAGSYDLNFPGYDASAAIYLSVERQVVGVGTDTLGIDKGNAKRYPAHVIFSSRNIWMLENVANLQLLPPRGFNLWVIPFKIDGGTGAPTRVLAKLNE